MRASIDFRTGMAGEVPLLLARAAGAEPPLPTVLWLHGFGVDSEVHRKELARLAEAGFLAVGVDAVGHGRRLLPDVVGRIRAAPNEEALPAMVDLAARTALEVPGVVDALVRDHGADEARMAVAGVSMGAYGVYRSVVVEPRLRVAAAILGSPEWPHPESPGDELEALARAALLSVVAERDENVPPAAARRLHERLESHFPEAMHRFVEIPAAVHLMNEEQWEVAMQEMLGWLRRHTGRSGAREE